MVYGSFPLFGPARPVVVVPGVVIQFIPFGGGDVLVQAFVFIVVGQAALYEVAFFHDGAAVGADPGVFPFYRFRLAVRAAGLIIVTDEVCTAMRAMAGGGGRMLGPSRREPVRPFFFLVRTLLGRSGQGPKILAARPYPGGIHRRALGGFEPLHRGSKVVLQFQPAVLLTARPGHMVGPVLPVIVPESTRFLYGRRHRQFPFSSFFSFFQSCTARSARS